MPAVISIAEALPPYKVEQERAVEFARELFSESFKDIERLLTIFQNGQIKSRRFVKDIEWFKEERSFKERNDAFIEAAVELGTEAIAKCLANSGYLKREVGPEEIDAIFFISTTGLATPSIEARIMNKLSFSPHTKRIPIWGLGCAGGAAGLSRAYEYCLAFPDSLVLVLSVELCSLTFQKNDRSKSNLVGTSLFADGASCALISGDKKEKLQKGRVPSILSTQSTLMPDSMDVMGWDIKNEGLYVIFSRDIPSIIEEWLQPNVMEFLEKQGLAMEDLRYFIAHPGGKKVLDAYANSLGINHSLMNISSEVLQEFGNMSSSTILYVLNRHMELNPEEGAYGLAAALGPGFSSELLLMRWEE
ncbi:type III polyketide synthase [Neobacillus notoginsengisoli]|uniref:Type III polyketide synthase n=1 Tax=Neobacillus notoginsengisoli TaxID=1578198 RepID=A0A417YY65_9BACI|nr:3-oxoacyl-[acyl-carrier-protein] synthase III C-terminal domain-containing protein [Neobacillus notoginsengisoli]RHW42295.1 type III polyketide synthase [Neobacillus notoginsengisoli]